MHTNFRFPEQVGHYSRGKFGVAKQVLLARRGEKLPMPATNTPLAADHVLDGLLQCSGVGLNQTQVEAVKSFLQEFKDIFAVDEGERTHTDLVQHTTDSSSVAPISPCPRQLPLAKQAIAEQLQKTSRSSTEWGSFTQMPMPCLASHAAQQTAGIVVRPRSVLIT